VEEEQAQRVFEPLDKKRRSREHFSCEVESLQQYFRTRAAQDLKKKAAAVFVLAEGQTVLGYYTLSNYTIEPGELPPEIERQFPNYPKLPATLIGRLARDQSYRGQGVGEKLLVDALQRCLGGTSTSGAIAVVVEAENDRARNFYREFGFIQFPDHPDKLFILMRTIEETLSEAL
jgi:ribosomal protein S18 acetylase RimI-like enzyme